MIRFKIVADLPRACLALLHMESGPAEAAGPRDGIDVLEPVEGAPWSGDRMHGARERLKDVLPGQARLIRLPAHQRVFACASGS